MLDNQESPSKELEQENKKLKSAVEFMRSHASQEYMDAERRADFAKKETQAIWEKCKVETESLQEQLTTTQQAFDSAREALEWQPIETAPKDGTYILVFDEESHSIELCKWMETKSWGDCWVSRDGICKLFLPTYWKSIPNPQLAKE